MVLCSSIRQNLYATDFHMDTQVRQKRPLPTDPPQRNQQAIRRRCSVFEMSRYTCDVFCKCRELHEPCNTACANRLEHKLCTVRNCSYYGECFNSASKLSENVIRKPSLVIDAGDGLFAKRDIAPGSLVVEYVGRRLSAETADKQRMLARWRLRPHTMHMYRLPDGGVIDGNPRLKPMGRPTAAASATNINTNANIGAGLINFSHEPNCAYINLLDDDRPQPIVRAFAYATEFIKADVELYSDYGKEFQMEGLDPVPCRCNASLCSKWVGVPGLRTKSSSSISRNNSPGVVADNASCSSIAGAPSTSSSSSNRRWPTNSATCGSSKRQTSVRRRGGRPSAQMAVFSATPHKILDLKLLDAETLSLVFMGSRADFCYPSAVREQNRPMMNDDAVDLFSPLQTTRANERIRDFDDFDENIWPSIMPPGRDDEYVPAGESASILVNSRLTDSDSASSKQNSAHATSFATATFTSLVTQPVFDNDPLLSSLARPLSQSSLLTTRSDGSVNNSHYTTTTITTRLMPPPPPLLWSPAVALPRLNNNNKPTTSATTPARPSDPNAAHLPSDVCNAVEKTNTRDVSTSSSPLQKRKRTKPTSPMVYNNEEDEDDIMFWSCGNLMLKAIFDD